MIRLIQERSKITWPTLVLSTFPGVSLVDNSIPKTNNGGRAVRARQSSHDANTTALTSEKGGNSKPKAEATSPVATGSSEDSSTVTHISKKIVSTIEEKVGGQKIISAICRQGKHKD